MNETKSIYELKICSSIPVQIHQEAEPEAPLQEDTLDRILRTNVLRVGYNPAVAPFSFLNVDGNIVGYDIAFAYELAYDLGVELDLIPLSYNELGQQLDENLYDIGMAAITISEHRLKEMTFTQPYMQPKIILITKEKERKLFSDLEMIQEDPLLNLAVLKGSAFERLAKELFPTKKSFSSKVMMTLFCSQKKQPSYGKNKKGSPGCSLTGDIAWFSPHLVLGLIL